MLLVFEPARAWNAAESRMRVEHHELGGHNAGLCCMGIDLLKRIDRGLHYVT
jgi:hypothetical protein